MMLFSRWRVPVLRRAVLGGLLLCGLSLICLRTAQAQEQPQQLTGKAFLEQIVPEYGPKYQDIDTAIEQLRSGRIADSRATLAAARQKNPELPPASMMLAEILFRINQVQAGVAALEEAVKEDPADPGPYVYLGELALQSRRWTESRLLYNKALELSANYTVNDKRKNRLLLNTYGGLATLAEADENWADSKQLLESLLKIEPENSLGLTRYGRVLFKMAKTREEENEAYKVFQRLHKANPEMTAYPDINMALLYEQADKRQNAEAMMKRAIEKDGTNPRTRLAVAKWAIDTNNMALAKENAEEAKKLDPTSLDAKLYVGLVARFSNDLPAAEKEFSEAHSQSPTHLGALTQLCLALVDQTDETKKQKALEYAQMNVQMHSDLNRPEGREAAVTLAWVLSRLGRTADAMRAIQQLLPAANTLSADSAYHAAQILFDSGQNDLARKILEPRLASDAVFPNRSDAEKLLNRIRNP